MGTVWLCFQKKALKKDILVSFLFYFYTEYINSRYHLYGKECMQAKENHLLICGSFGPQRNRSIHLRLRKRKYNFMQRRSGYEYQKQKNLP